MIRGGLRGHTTVTVELAPAPGKHGDPAPVEDSDAEPDTYQVPGCWLAPLDTTEIQNLSDTVITTRTLYAPASGVFPPTAKVTIGDFVGQVDGDPEPWGRAGQAVRLRRVTG